MKLDRRSFFASAVAGLAVWCGAIPVQATSSFTCTHICDPKGERCFVADGKIYPMPKGVKRFDIAVEVKDGIHRVTNVTPST